MIVKAILCSLPRLYLGSQLRVPIPPAPMMPSSAPQATTQISSGGAITGRLGEWKTAPLTNKSTYVVFCA
jgi:hypothetical protein